MSIDLGDSPTPPNANPTGSQKLQIKKALGLDVQGIKHFSDSDPSSYTIDQESTVIVSGVTFEGVELPPKTYYYAGTYNGFFSFTEDGSPVDEFTDSIFLDAIQDNLVLLFNQVMFQANPASIFVPKDMNDAYWFTDENTTGYTPPKSFIFPTIQAVESDRTGQVLVWKDTTSGLYGDPYDTYFLSVYKDQGPFWVRFLTYNGDYGTPYSIDLANAQNLPLATGVSGVLGVAYGGTGATTSVGISGSNTNRLLIEDIGTTTINVTDTFSGKIIRTTSSSAVTINIPNTLSSRFNMRVIQQGTGQVTFVGTGGATLQSKLTYKKISAQYGVVDVLRVASGICNLSGDLSA